MMDQTIEDLFRVSESDRRNAAMKDMAESLCRFYLALVAGGIPSEAALLMTGDVHRAMLMNAFGLRGFSDRDE